MTTDASPTRSMTRTQVLTIVATGLGMFMVFLDVLVVNVALPDIQTEFDVGESGAQAIVTTYSIGMAVTIMWSASLADQRGRRLVYVGALAVFTVASVISGLAPTFEVLVAARTLQGLAAGPITVTSLAALSAAFVRVEERRGAIGIWQAVASTGTALGPTLGGVLTQEIGWRSVFLVNVPVCVLALFLTLSFVKESRDPHEMAFDYPGQLSFAVAIAAFAGAIITAPQAGWLSPIVIGLFVLVVVAGVFFVRRERSTEDAMVDLTLFENRVYRVGLITLFVMFFAPYGMLLITTQYYQNVRDYSAIGAGFLMLPFAVGILITSPQIGRLDKKYGQPRLVQFAIALMAVSFVGITVALAIDPIAVAAMTFVAGISAAIGFSTITAISVESVTPDRAGMASGIVGTQRALGSTAGYAVLGSIFAMWLNFRLEDELEPVLTNAAERRDVTEAIIDQANPSAQAAEVGPGGGFELPLRPAVEAEVIDAADSVFVTAMQIPMALGAITLGLMFVIARRVIR